ncbi:zinc finger protein RFP-like isoform X2 [Ambystoma mexicanum]|uniref:zinc finger protein RFP-like isoform X2 n=1 Tax=Ambystoma mexicanum TaxID=8296 RepID=UPI0037E76583
MAAAGPLGTLVEDATCSVCLKFYEDPVITECGHNFCRACLNQCWESTDPPPQCPQCPQCRGNCSLENLRPNHQLRNMVEQVKKMQAERALEKHKCEKHDEKLKVFCKEDQRAICTVCSFSADHKSHTMVPIEEAALEYKGELQDWLTLLRKEADGFLESKGKEEAKYRTMRNMLEKERLKTVEDFEKLRHILKEQEEGMHRRLEKMNRKITEAENSNITKLSNQICSLNALINEVEMKTEHPAEELLENMLEKTVEDFEKLRHSLKEQEEGMHRRLEEMNRKITEAENSKITKLSNQICSLNALINEVEMKSEHPAEELLEDIRSILRRCENVTFQRPEKCLAVDKGDSGYPLKPWLLTHVR